MGPHGAAQPSVIETLLGASGVESAARRHAETLFLLELEFLLRHEQSQALRVFIFSGNSGAASGEWTAPGALLSDAQAEGQRRAGQGQRLRGGQKPLPVPGQSGLRVRQPHRAHLPRGLESLGQDERGPSVRDSLRTLRGVSHSRGRRERTHPAGDTACRPLGMLKIICFLILR